jgi:methionyl-tRNA formyltransferase
MRVIFIGRKNFANHCFANWLAERHELVAYFRADIERYTQGYRMKWLQKRIRRHGMVRALDQMTYHVYYRFLKQQRDQEVLAEAFEKRFGRKFFKAPAGVPYYQFDDLNSPEAVQVLTDLKPDLVFASCVTQYFKKPYMEIPRLGTVLYHEGLTPEYKGLHTAFWALHNGEAPRIGYTLLQIDEKIDHGSPLAQGVGMLDPELITNFAYAGHKTLADGLPDVEKALATLERGERPVIKREKGAAKMYTYPGMTDQIRSWWRRYRATSNAQPEVRQA